MEYGAGLMGHSKAKQSEGCDTHLDVSGIWDSTRYYITHGHI
jgi:hypothetical protein